MRRRSPFLNFLLQLFDRLFVWLFGLNIAQCLVAFPQKIQNFVVHDLTRGNGRGGPDGWRHRGPLLESKRAPLEPIAVRAIAALAIPQLSSELDLAQVEIERLLSRFKPCDYGTIIIFVIHRPVYVIMDPLIELIKLQFMSLPIVLSPQIHLVGIFGPKLVNKELRLIKYLRQEE